MSKLLLNRVEDNLVELGITKSKFYLVAFSGGPDSTFLLYALNSLGYRNIFPIYINYKDSPHVNQEIKIVEDLCNSLNLKLIRHDIERPISKSDGNFEAVAREYRYNFFVNIAKRIKIFSLLLAHQQDDHLLTYVMQKERHSIVSTYGLPKLTKYKELDLYRPLLNISKEEIIGFLKFNEIPYYDDITNYNLERTRNRYRETLLPSINREKLEEEIRMENENLQKERKIIDGFDFYSPLPNYKYYSLSESLKLYYLYELIKVNMVRKEEREIIASRNLAFEFLSKENSTKSIELNSELTLYRNYDSFYVNKTIKQEDYSYTIYSSGIYENKDFIIDLTDIKKFNLKLADFPITIRNFKQGDEFSTDIVSTSVNSFLKTHKVPYYLRESYPVFVNNKNEIVCVPFFEDIISNRITFIFKKYKI